MAGIILAAPPASAQSPAAKLQACRAAAEAAAMEPDPTDFKCDWRAVVKAAPGAALTGRFDARAKGLSGTLTILEAGGAPALVAIQTVSRASAHTCTVSAKATRGADDTLTAKPEDAGSCNIRIVSSGRNVVRVSADQCQDLCGARGSFAGEYRLRQR